MRSLGTQAIWQRRTTLEAMTLYTSRPRIECVIQTSSSSSQGGEALLNAATAEGMTLAGWRPSDPLAWRVRVPSALVGAGGIGRHQPGATSTPFCPRSRLLLSR